MSPGRDTQALAAAALLLALICVGAGIVRQLAGAPADAPVAPTEMASQ